MGALLSTLFLGAVVGSIYALDAYGLVLTYRTSGVFNFAQGALGMFFAYVFFQLAQGGKVELVVGTYTQTWAMPRYVALVFVVLVLAPAVGWGLEVALFRKLRSAGSVVQIVATIGLLISLQGLAGVIWGSATTLTPRSIFSTRVFAAGDFRASIEQIATVVIVAALGAGMVLFLRRSPLGIRMRAVVDRADIAEVMGVDSHRVAAIAWALATSFAALAGILVVPFFGSLDTGTLTFLVIAATSAAVVARLESLPLALAGGWGIGMAQLLVQKYVSGEAARLIRPSIPFLVLFAVLLLPIRWPAEPQAATAAQEPAAAPPGTPRWRAGRMGLLAAVLVLPPFLLTGVLEKVLGGDWQRQLALVPPMALIFLSLVVIVGYAGQISLSQAALAGFGAFIAAHLVADNGWPLLLAAVAGGLATLPLGALLASRAASLPPLFLGFATLAFGAVMDDFAFTSRSFSNGLSGIRVDRGELLASNRAYYLVGLAVFAVAALLVRNLRNGRTGLALAAMRDTAVGIGSVGTDVTRLKFLSFCLSAFLAGLGGAMFSGARELASPIDYFKILSLLMLALAVIGGISRWTGALAGAALFQLMAPIFHQPFFSENIVFKNVFGGQLEALLPVFFGLGAIGLARNPHGIVEQVREGVAAARAGRRPPPPVAVVAAPGDEDAGDEDGGAARGPRAGAGVAGADGDIVAFADATLYHRPDCVLTTGKRPRRLTVALVRRLRPCPVCDPPAAYPAARLERPSAPAAGRRTRPLRARRPPD